MSRLLWATMMTAPSPRSPVNHSPTTAPMTERGIEMRKAAKRYGRELGALSLKNISRLDAFREVEEVDLFGPWDVERRGGILSFYSSDVHPHDLGTFMDQEGVAIRTGHHCTMPLMGALGVPATARASLYVYNTEREVDALVDALKRALRYFGDGVSPAR